MTNQDAGVTPNLLATHPLLRPLTASQQRFVDTLFARMTVPGNDWPTFDFVKRKLRPHGIDAATELAAFPIGANRGNASMGYRHIWAEGGGHVVNEGSRVRLTIAGIREESTGAGRPFADYLARVVGKLAILEESIAADADTVAVATFDLAVVLSGVGGSNTYRDFVPLIASVLEREPPIFGCARPSGSAEEEVLAG